VNVIFQEHFSRFLPALFVALLLLEGCASTGRDKSRKSENTDKADKAPSDRELTRIAQAHAHYSAGLIAQYDDDKEAALDEFFQAAKLDLNNESLTLEVSQRLIQEHQHEKAISLLKASSERPTASAAIYSRLALVYSQMGKPDLSLAANRQAIKKAPRSLLPYQNIVLIYLQKKQPAEAIRTLDEAAVQSGYGPERYITLAELYAGVGLQFPERRKETNLKAATALKHAEKLGVTQVQMKVRVADDYAGIGEAARATAIYLELSRRADNTPELNEELHQKLAESYMRSNDQRGAEEQLEAILKKDPTNPKACYALGAVMFEGKKFQEAADLFRRTIVLRPDFEPAYYELARTQLALERSSDSLATLDTARRRFQQSFLLEYITAMAFSQEKGFNEAVRHFTSAEIVAQATQPQYLDAYFYFHYAAACERSGDITQAEKLFEKSLHLQPDFAEALNYLGYMWADRSTNLAKAHAMIEKAVKMEPKNAAYLDSLGWVLFRLNHSQEALDYVLRAVALSRKEGPDAALYDHLGDIYTALHQPQKAREAWEKALSLEATDAVRKKLEQASKP
jgi:tetratricopeptide (TPR) repeat protein